jgi:PAS domain S-box-containing protein
VFHSSPDAIGIIRMADGTVLDINEAFTRLLGYSHAEIVDNNWFDFNLIPANERERLNGLFQEKGMAGDIEVNLATKEGGVATMLISLSPILIGEEPCVLMIAHDISKRKRAEEALRRVQDELALGIQERTALEERQRLARELHDSVSQALYGISLGAHTALSIFDTDRSKTFEALNYIISLVEAGLTEMRALIFELRPESLEMEGLVNAIIKQTAALRARHGVEVELKLCEEPDVPFSVKEALYRVAQEALQNAVKHARPSRLDVRMNCELDCLWLEVQNDGMSFDPQATYPGHLGLRSMRERVMKLGGSLEIISQPGAGTQVRARVPITPPQ